MGSDGHNWCLIKRDITKWEIGNILLKMVWEGCENLKIIRDVSDIIRNLRGVRVITIFIIYGAFALLPITSRQHFGNCVARTRHCLLFSDRHSSILNIFS